MRIDILTLFPDMFTGPFNESIIYRAVQKGLIHINLVNIRSFSKDKHLKVDDYPYGGGAGMVMKPEPLFAAIESAQQNSKVLSNQRRTILMTPQGEVFTQDKAKFLSKFHHLIIVCGHYEGVDERVVQTLITDEISIGDYVLTGGEIPAMAVTDAVSRLVPGVLGTKDSLYEESFSDGLLEYPQYTRPEEFRGMSVPDVLRSGNHEEIRKWRRMESLKRTALRRPEILNKIRLSDEDEALLKIIREGKSK
jgi:tRNA (guanine37-N1)-methyltransferase